MGGPADRAFWGSTAQGGGVPEKAYASGTEDCECCD